MNGIMTRRYFMKAAAGSLAAALPLSACGTKERPRRRPNFVFFLVDDLGWKDLVCFGSPFYETPNVDRLARSGMKFTDAYAACPVCSPTRASIMTGKYPARVGITDWIPGFVEANDKLNLPLNTPQDGYELPLAEVTVAEALKEAGYATFFAGKWHLGREPYHPDKQGFDTNIGGNHTGQPRGGYFSPYDNPQLPDGPEGEYLTDRLTAESLAFLDGTGGAPFLLYLSFYTVHTPIQSKKDYEAKYERKRDDLPAHDGPRFTKERESRVRMVQDDPAYAGMVQSMDESVGRILDKLEELGVADDTVVIFMSDNGGLSTVPWEAPTSNVPLRAGKGWLYEGGIRTPMIVRWPGVTEPGSVCGEPVTSTDFYPTMLEMAGLPSRPGQHADGVSRERFETGRRRARGRLEADRVLRGRVGRAL